MGTNLLEIPEPRKYRHHALAFKREVVEQSLAPTASVAKLAQEHGINANQIFAWRKAYRDGRLDEGSSGRLIAVQVTDTSQACTRPVPVNGRDAPKLSLTVGSAVLEVAGDVSPVLLRAAIDALLGR